MKTVQTTFLGLVIVALIGCVCAERCKVDKSAHTYQQVPMFLPTENLHIYSKKLIQAIEQVESGGDCNAIGDNGQAVGCLQIWPIMVDDVNRISGRKYTYADRYSRQKSYEMFEIYMNHYCNGFTDEQIARCWNGGPKGYLKESTKVYWAKVKEAKDGL